MKPNLVDQTSGLFESLCNLHNTKLHNTTNTEQLCQHSFLLVTISHLKGGQSCTDISKFNDHIPNEPGQTAAP